MKRIFTALPFVFLGCLFAAGVLWQLDKNIGETLKAMLKGDGKVETEKAVGYLNGTPETVSYFIEEPEKPLKYFNEEPKDTAVYLNGKPHKTNSYTVNWKHITDGSDGKFIVYVNVNSFRRRENIVTFWQKWVYSEDQKVTVGTGAQYESSKYREERKKTIVDCWNMESGVIFDAYYTEGNKFVLGSTYENPIFTPDVPDTFSYEIAEFVCGEAVPELTK